jgi:flagellin-specific chaperone FliS
MPNYVNVETIKAVEEFDNAINKAIADRQQNPQVQQAQQNPQVENLYNLYIDRLVKLEELYNQQNIDESMKKNAIE